MFLAATKSWQKSMNIEQRKKTKRNPNHNSQPRTWSFEPTATLLMKTDGDWYYNYQLSEAWQRCLDLKLWCYHGHEPSLFPVVTILLLDICALAGDDVTVCQVATGNEASCPWKHYKFILTNGHQIFVVPYSTDNCSTFTLNS